MLLTGENKCAHIDRPAEEPVQLRMPLPCAMPGAEEQQNPVPEGRKVTE